MQKNRFGRSRGTGARALPEVPHGIVPDPFAVWAGLFFMTHFAFPHPAGGRCRPACA